MPPREISNLQLTCAHIPECNAALEEIMAFALTFNGYTHAGDHLGTARIWRKIKNRFKAGKPLGEDLSDLRTALFYEQRITHDSWEGPDEPFVRAVLAVIIRCVCIPDALQAAK